MAKFYVGQRVRIKYMRHPYWMHLAGREGTVVPVGNPTGYINPFEYFVSADGDDGYPCGLLAEQIEPISDSNTKISWEEMKDLWTPASLENA